jgi:hypothetical protein
MYRHQGGPTRRPAAVKSAVSVRGIGPTSWHIPPTVERRHRENESTNKIEKQRRMQQETRRALLVWWSINTGRGRIAVEVGSTPTVHTIVSNACAAAAQQRNQHKSGLEPCTARAESNKHSTRDSGRRVQVCAAAMRRHSECQSIRLRQATSAAAAASRNQYPRDRHPEAEVTRRQLRAQ